VWTTLSDNTHSLCNKIVTFSSFAVLC